MNINRIRTLMAGVVLSCLMMPMTGFSHEAVDPLHAIPVETVDSRLAYPTEIHVQVTDQGVEVKGTLKRKVGHKRQSLRGHVDVELLDTIGRIIESKKQSLRSRGGSAKHDHSRDFSVVLPLPEAKEFSVRVRHSIGGDDHEQTE